jgi:hypothetical protein
MTLRILSVALAAGALAASAAFAGDYPITNDKGRIIGYSDYPARPADATALQDVNWDFSKPMNDMKALFGNKSESATPSSETPSDVTTPPSDTTGTPAPVQRTNDKNRRL